MQSLYIMPQPVCCDKNSWLRIPARVGRPWKKANVGHWGKTFIPELHPSSAVIEINKEIDSAGENLRKPLRKKQGGPSQMCHRPL